MVSKSKKQLPAKVQNKDSEKKQEEFTINAKPNIVDPSEEGQRALISAKIALIRSFPFLGILVMNIEYLFTDSIPTMGATTEPHNTIYINEEFTLKGLPSKKERSFVIAHEVLHIFLDHIGRQTSCNYDPKLWNIAADYCINGYLKELIDDASNSSIKNLIEMPKSALYKQEFLGKSSDEIYHILLKDAKNNPQQAVQNCCGQGKPGEGDPGGNGGIGGDYNDGNQRPFDELSGETVSDVKQAENKQAVAASMGQAEQFAKQMGKGTSALLREFQKLIEPVIPWMDVLRDYITDKAANHYTYNRISRRSPKNICMPTLDGEFVELVFGVDTSGSMSSKDLAEALSELKGICEQFENWKVTLLSCDTNANIIGEYESEEGDDFTTIDKGLIGGGGTDMNPMVQYANDMEEPPSVNVIITDGYIPDIPAVDEIPTIVVVTSDGNDDLKLDNCIVLFMKNGRQ